MQRRWLTWVVLAWMGACSAVPTEPQKAELGAGGSGGSSGGGRQQPERPTRPVIPTLGAAGGGGSVDDGAAHTGGVGGGVDCRWDCRRTEVFVECPQRRFGFTYYVGYGGDVGGGTSTAPDAEEACAIAEAQVLDADGGAAGGSGLRGLAGAAACPAFEPAMPGGPRCASPVAQVSKLEGQCEIWGQCCTVYSVTECLNRDYAGEGGNGVP